MTDNRAFSGNYCTGTVIDINDPHQSNRCLVRWHGINDGLQPNELQWAYLRKQSQDPAIQQLGQFMGLRPGTIVYGISTDGDSQGIEISHAMHKTGTASSDGSTQPNADIPQPAKSEQVGPNISSDQGTYSQPLKGDVFPNFQFSSANINKDIRTWALKHGPPNKSGESSNKKAKTAANKDSIGYYTFGNAGGEGNYSTGSKGSIPSAPGSLTNHLAQSGMNRSGAVPNAPGVFAGGQFYNKIIEKGVKPAYDQPGYSKEEHTNQQFGTGGNSSGNSGSGSDGNKVDFGPNADNDDTGHNKFLGTNNPDFYDESQNQADPGFTDQQLQDMNSGGSDTSPNGTIDGDIPVS